MEEDDRNLFEVFRNEAKGETQRKAPQESLRGEQHLRWDLLTDWGFEDPFIGVPVQRKTEHTEKWVKEMYGMLGQKPDTPHPCKPRNSLTSPSLPDFRLYDTKSYEKEATAAQSDDSVLRVSNLLNSFSHEDYYVTSGPYTKCARDMMAVACREMTRCCPLVKSAIPVSFNLADLSTQNADELEDYLSR